MRSFQLNRFDIALWISGLLVSVAVVDLSEMHKFAFPLAIVASLIYLHRTAYRIPHTAYLLFFSVSIASILGFTQVLNGSHAESSNLSLFGLSFYSASLAYLISAESRLNTNHALQISNPLLLSTGPIAIFIRQIGHKQLKRRINYYAPFIIIGIFFFTIIATPLTEFFFLIEKTDAISSIAFALIFEIFVYMNFCGLSLIIYGLFGILGYKIPLNFKQPFSSRNIVDFWKGWHTSLSAVLKRLFYNPLRERYPLFIALSGVYLASALWHGVTVNFILWGLFHAAIFWVSLIFLKRGKVFIPLLLLPPAIVLGRLIFADTNTDRLLEKLLFSYKGFDIIDAERLSTIPKASAYAFGLGLCLILVEFFFNKTLIVKKRNYKYLRTPIALTLIVFLFVMLASKTGVNYAVYGQR